MDGLKKITPTHPNKTYVPFPDLHMSLKKGSLRSPQVPKKKVLEISTGP